eukprot:4487201-Pleurochrysis_carterae.AAC.2
MLQHNEAALSDVPQSFKGWNGVPHLQKSSKVASTTADLSATPVAIMFDYDGLGFVNALAWACQGCAQVGLLLLDTY